MGKADNLQDTLSQVLGIARGLLGMCLLVLFGYSGPNRESGSGDADLGADNVLMGFGSLLWPCSIYLYIGVYTL